MIKLEKTEVLGWEAAIRGMRNPMNSWKKSDSGFPMRKIKYDPYTRERVECTDLCWDGDYKLGDVQIGKNDYALMMGLAEGGPVHAKYRRMITVYVDITAPLYWWKEFDTYKVGTVANSCSTMHKIHEKEFTTKDFSCEHLKDMVPLEGVFAIAGTGVTGYMVLELTICALNYYREQYIKTNDKLYWWQMIQLLPSSYNQKRTVMMNYEVLAGIYKYRRDHKLDEWREFCKWIKTLPYSEIITEEPEVTKNG